MELWAGFFKKHFDEWKNVSRNEVNYNKDILIIFSAELFVFCSEKSWAIGFAHEK